MNANLLIAQGGGPTAVINCSLYGVIRQAQANGKVHSVLGACHGITGVLNEQFIDLGAQEEAVIEGLKSTPGAALGSCRHKVKGSDCPQILEVLNQHEIRYFLYNGGNDSMDTALQLHRLAQRDRYDLKVIGIPKTVDNDLPETDRCPGYGSAARYVAQSVRDLGMDIRSLPTPVSIFEAMGRNAGWLAAASALARRAPDDAPHLIYLPERVFNPDQLLADVQRVYERLGWVVVVVSEGIKLANGAPVYAHGGEAQTDDFGHALPGDVGSYLANLLSTELGLRSRSEKPGLCARSSIELASAVDQQDAEAVGRAAVDAARAGESGVTVTLLPRTSADETPRTGLTPLEQTANKEKLVPENWITSSGNNVTDEFCAYVRPLIGKELMEYVRF